MSGSRRNQDYSLSLKDWRIGVISTDYDLQLTRKAILDDLRSLGFATIAFEQNDFPVQPNLHSHDACLRAVATMDIVVLILDRRYGGLYLGTGDKSITEREFWDAFERKAVIITCVSKKLFDDRNESKKRVKQLMKERGISEEQAKIEIKPGYADKWELINFLDRIQYSRRDQFMNFYENSDQLIESVRGRLAAATPHFCRLLLKQQLNWVDSQRSTTGLFESLGHISTSSLYISPPSRINSGFSKKRKPSSVIAEMMDGAGNVLLTGSPGGGKTVELVRAFKRYAKKALKTKEFRLPFYLPLKGKGLWYHFDFAKYIVESFADHLNRKPYPCFDARHLDPVFYIDGLDEGPVTPTISQVDTIVASPILQSSCVMTARSAFARQVVDNSTLFASNIATRAELLSWTREHAKSFAVRYLKSHKRLSESETVLNYIEHLPETHPIIKSPLILSLLLWLVDAEGAETICSREMGLGLLFELFLQTWAIRELIRHDKAVVTAMEANAKMLLMMWEIVAWCILKARENGVDLTFIDLQNELASLITAENKPLLSSPAFKALIRFSQNGRIVAGMLHDQFMEYLLARWFVRRCIDRPDDLEIFLGKQINVDVNRFIKSIWLTSSRDDLETIIKNLETIARKADNANTPSALIAHANCVYYISRVPIEDARSTLRRLLSGAEHLYCKNGILFALLRLGDLAAEKELYESLSTDVQADRINRGLHLEYFKDAMPGELGMPPIDNNSIDWESCLIGMIDHIADDSERFALSRRIDLYTIRSLLMSRGKLGPLTPERLRAICSTALAGENIKRLPHEIREGISLELNELLRTVRKLSNIE